jgi:hypothetical protein
VTIIYSFCKIIKNETCKLTFNGKHRKGEVLVLKKATLLQMCLAVIVLMLCACQVQPEQTDENLAVKPEQTMEAPQTTEVNTVPTKPESETTDAATEPTVATQETTAKPTEPEMEITPNTFAPKPEKEEDPQNTTKPTESKQDKDIMLDWKVAYLDFLETVADEHELYALVHIGGDDIPELYLRGAYEAGGDGICTYKNGMVIEERLNRIGGECERRRILCCHQRGFRYLQGSRVLSKYCVL